MGESEEIWRPIVGYEGLYEVSDCGNVRSVDREIKNKGGLTIHLKGKIIVQKVHKCGYTQVALCKDGKCKFKLVHRLVAEAFIPNPDNLPQVNHINETKTCNRLDNLEWVSAKDNINHGTAIQRMTKKLKGFNPNAKKVNQYDFDGNLIATYPSTRDCDKYGFSSRCISYCCNGITKSHKGYIWKYE